MGTGTKFFSGLKVPVPRVAPITTIVYKGEDGIVNIIRPLVIDLLTVPRRCFFCGFLLVLVFRGCL